MAKGKNHHIFVDVLHGNDENDGSEQFPFKTTDRAKRLIELKGKCTGIRVLNAKVDSSPCGAPKCGCCVKANGRRSCPGQDCDKWISVSAKHHPECGWRKIEEQKKPVEKEPVYRPDDNHGFEKLKRKMIALATQASMQYGWDGIIMGYAARVGRGGSTGRITFVSPQNELYCLDDRGTIKVRQGLEEHLTINADNALTLIRQKICPAERSQLMLKPDHMLGEQLDMPVQGPELPHGMDDKSAHDLGSDLPLQWLAAHSVMSDKRVGPGAGVPQHAAAILGLHGPHVAVDVHLPVEAAVLEEHKRKLAMAQLDVGNKRSRVED